MTIDKLYFKNDKWILEDLKKCVRETVNIVFVFADKDVIQKYNHNIMLKKIYPNAHIVGTSTAGNIFDDSLSEYTAIATAVSFDTSQISIKTLTPNAKQLFEDGKKLIDSIEKEKLKHIFILSRGLGIDNSELIKGMNSHTYVPITGGLAGDGSMYHDTYVFADDVGAENLVIAVCFYGESLNIEVACKAGWEEFGAQRTITSSQGNILYEIDNKPAIKLYEKYLGEYINDLPESGLLFPLSIKMDENSENEVIRVMMGVNDDGSITFAGDVPQGASARLMKTNVNNLIDGSEVAAKSIHKHNNKRSLTLVVSCTGRLSVLKQLVNEELEVIQDTLGKESQLIGFYSYGEISPFNDDLLNCKLHNQTMTITSIYED